MSLYAKLNAEIFRGYSGHLGILCGMLGNPFELLFAGQKLKNLGKSKILVNMDQFSQHEWICTE